MRGFSAPGGISTKLRLLALEGVEFFSGMIRALPIDLDAAVLELSANDPVLAQLIARIGPCELESEPKPDIFQALLRSIIYQQLHGRAAAAIHARVLATMPSRSVNASAFLSVPEEDLRAAGLSANKLRAVRDLAAKTLEGVVPTAAAAARLSDEELVERLTVVRGIGSWTVHMLMIFSLGVRTSCRLEISRSARPSASSIGAGGKQNPRRSCATRGAGGPIAPWQAGIFGVRSIPNCRRPAKNQPQREFESRAANANAVDVPDAT